MRFELSSYELIQLILTIKCSLSLKKKLVEIWNTKKATRWKRNLQFIIEHSIVFIKILEPMVLIGR